ncbi:GDP-L-fucose synthase [Methylophilaceae bacterium]|nr:GDP-L-fucose synthase [Methylophilaceae bacterium]
MSFNDSTKIYVAGHRGLVGSAICRELKNQGYKNIITRSHAELDLKDQDKTEKFILNIKPDIVFLAAAKVGGILANNSYPVDFLMDNLAIQSNIIRASYLANVKRLIFLGSSCIYPKKCPQPIKEEYLLSSDLEPTNRAYALAKIAGVEMCWSYNRQFDTKYLAAMPTNLYGPNDNYDLSNSHVLPALIRKIHDAKINDKATVEIWGTGEPRREFLHVDDLAKALIILSSLKDDSFQKLVGKDVCPLINIGSGVDLKIKELASLIKKTIGFKGNFVFDKSKPDGTLRKVMNIEKIKLLGWRPQISLEDGLCQTYKNYKS